MFKRARWLRTLHGAFSAHRASCREASQYLRQIAAIEVAREIDRLRDASRRSADPLRLTRCERRVFSQFGEDGITLEIFRRIRTTNRQFVEFGVGTGLENNTAYLLMTGWRGVWIEMDIAHLAAIRGAFGEELTDGRLTLLPNAVTPENVEELFGKAGVSNEPDLLSIDIDGNDYYVWRAIGRYRPRVVVIEYNAMFPPDQRWRMRERADGVPITSYFGASLASLCDLGQDKGYALVGCSLGGANAFFVRQDLISAETFAAPFTAENHYEPPRYYLHPQWVGHERRNGPSVLD